MEQRPTPNQKRRISRGAPSMLGVLGAATVLATHGLWAPLFSSDNKTQTGPQPVASVPHGIDHFGESLLETVRPGRDAQMYGAFDRHDAKGTLPGGTVVRVGCLAIDNNGVDRWYLTLGTNDPMNPNEAAIGSLVAEQDFTSQGPEPAPCSASELQYYGVGGQASSTLPAPQQSAPIVRQV